MSVINDFAKNVSTFAKATTLGVLAMAATSCGGDKPGVEPGGGEPPVTGAKGSFKVVGEAARIDMVGTDLIPGRPDRGIPEVPPTMTKLFAFYYQNGKEQYLGGNVVANGTEKFGFKRNDASKPVTFSKIDGYTDRYRMNNASHLFFVNNQSDTTALKITNDSQVISFTNQVSAEYVYKEAMNGSYIKLQKAEL